MSLRPAIILAFLFATSNLFASIGSTSLIDQQMVNLNIQIKGKKKPIKADLAMPFYQTAELEKKIDNKDYYFELNPRKGKDSSEIELEVRLMNKNGSKVVAKKEIIAKINKQATVSMKGMTFKVTPQI